MGGGAAAGGDFDALLTQRQNEGWRGLFKNGRALGLACFASLGGVLYGYNQVYYTVHFSIACHLLMSCINRVFSVKSKSCTILSSDTPLL